jgi:RimJ/RimL family protein N-acetyltransferase
MGKPAAYLCVTREHLILPQGIDRVRWIGERDLDANKEPFFEGGQSLWSLDEWRQLAEEGYRYCGIFEGERICSMAGVWKRMPDVWEVIAVGTKVRHQRRGLAKAVVTFAGDYILKHVSVATYTTGAGNAASIRTAESVGFRRCTNMIGCENWCMMSPRPEVVGRTCPLLP